jgi:hypothetical protein
MKKIQVRFSGTVQHDSLHTRLTLIPDTVWDRTGQDA